VAKSGAATDNAGTIIVSSVDSNRYVERVYDGRADLGWFVDGGGIVDDSSALTNALGLGGSFSGQDLTMLINTQVSIDQANDFDIELVNCKILAGTTDMAAPLAFGSTVLSVKIKGLEIDGDAKSYQGLSCESCLDLDDCDFHNFAGTVSVGSCIALRLILAKVSRINVRNSSFYDCTPHTGGSTGDASGSARGIYLQWGSGCAGTYGEEGTFVSVEKCNIYNITGREGDAFQLADNINTTGDHNANLFLKNVKIGRANRRGMKLFGSNVTLENVTIDGLDAADPDLQTNAGLIAVGPSLASSRVRNFSMNGCTLINKGGLNSSLFLTDLDEFSVNDNKFLIENTDSTGRGWLSLDGAKRGTVDDNYVELETVGLSLTTDCENVAIKNNQFYFKRLSPRSLLEPSLTSGLNNIVLSDNHFDISSEVETNNSLLAIWYFNVSATASYDNVIIKGNTISEHTGGRGFVVWFANQTISGARVINNHKNGTSNPMNLGTGDLSGCVFVRNSSDDTYDQQYSYSEVTGSRGGNAALADLLTELDGLNIITDSTTA
jgi:hypothetical protein